MENNPFDISDFSEKFFETHTYRELKSYILSKFNEGLKAVAGEIEKKKKEFDPDIDAEFSSPLTDPTGVDGYNLGISESVQIINKYLPPQT